MIQTLRQSSQQIGWNLFNRLLLSGLLLTTVGQLNLRAQNSVRYDYTGTVQSFTVPAGGTYQVKLTAKGADGGESAQKGGVGATVAGAFNLQGGSEVTIIVGQRGTNGSASGGGGGTGVLLKNPGSALLLVAGGGGGSARGNGGNGLSDVANPGIGSGGTADNDFLHGGGGGGINGRGEGYQNYGGGQAQSTTISLGGTNNNGTSRGGNGFGGGGNGGSAAGSFGGGGGGGGGYTGGNGAPRGTVGAFGDGGKGGTSYLNAALGSSTTPASVTSADGNGYVLLELTPVGPVTRYVRTDGTNPVASSATSWSAASSDFQAVINASAPGDQVWVAAGTYKPGGNTNIDRYVSFSMKNGVAIYGGFPADGSGNMANRKPASYSTILSGDIGNPNDKSDNTYNVILNSSSLNLTSTSVLDGFVITAGNATNDRAGGGGMHNDGSNGSICNPTIRNCSFVNNTAGFGGGMVNNGGSGTSSPTLINCSFSNNTAAYGGGIYNDVRSGTSRPQLTNCSFTNNAASFSGGAAYNYGGNGGNSSPTFNNCSFTGNTADSGGGMCNDSRQGNSSPTLTNCSFTGNTAGVGGGMYNYGHQGTSSPTLINCSFSNNMAGHGGGICNNGSYSSVSSPILINCSFSNNTATDGGGIYNDSAYGTSSPQLTNCSLYNNKADNGGGIYNSTNEYGTGSPQLTNCILWNNGGGSAISGGPVTANYSLIEAQEQDYTGSGNRTNDPLFVNPDQNDLRLLGCSPAINAGDPNSTNATSGSTDLAGNPRFYNGGRIDIGALEFQAAPTAVTGLLTQPAESSVVCAGTAVSVPVSVSGTVSSYQWYKDGNLLTGQNTTTLTLPNTTPASSGTYSLVVTGTCNSLTSTAFSLTVNQTSPPSLLSQAGQSYPGGQAKLTVSQFSPSVNLVISGCTGGTINWTGPNNTTGITAPIVVPTSAPGSVVYQASCTQNGCTSAPASATVTVQSGALQLIAPSYDCLSGAITFRTQGGNGAPIEFFAIGVTGWTTNPNQFVDTQLRTSADAKPLTLYARQSGQQVSYSFDLRAQCQASPNEAPSFRGPLPSLTTVQGGSLSYSLPGGTFADPENQPLTLSASGYPAGLSFQNGLFSGSPTQAGSFTVIVKATDPGGLSAQGPWLLTVLASTGSPLQLLSPDYNCQSGAIMFKTQGGDGSRIEYFAIGITGWTTNPNQFVDKGLRTASDAKPITLRARQSGKEVSFSFDIRARCPLGSPRQGLLAEGAEPGLGVEVLGNPVGDVLRVRLRGTAGQRVGLRLVSMQGKAVVEQGVVLSESVQEVEVGVGGCKPGLYVLEADLGQQRRRLRVLKR